MQSCDILAGLQEYEGYLKILAAVQRTNLLEKTSKPFRDRKVLSKITEALTHYLLGFLTKFYRN